MALTLYYHPLSSYCHKVLVALYERGVPFEKRLINLGDAADRQALAALWPITKFPVLRDEARHGSVAEASIIIEYLDQNTPGAPLIPPEPQAALEVRLWDRIFDNYLQGPMQAIVDNQLRQLGMDLSRQRAMLATVFAMIDQRLSDRTWAGASGFTLADCAATPGLFFASVLEPFPAQLRHLQAYFERLMDRPSVQRVIKEAQPYFGMFPFAQDIPARFLEEA